MSQSQLFKSWLLQLLRLCHVTRPRTNLHFWLWIKVTRGFLFVCLTCLLPASLGPFPEGRGLEWNLCIIKYCDERNLTWSISSVNHGLVAAHANRSERTVQINIITADNKGSVGFLKQWLTLMHLKAIYISLRRKVFQTKSVASRWRDLATPRSWEISVGCNATKSTFQSNCFL